jgi:hypothetical protein
MAINMKKKILAMAILTIMPLCLLITGCGADADVPDAPPPIIPASPDLTPPEPAKDELAGTIWELIMIEAEGMILDKIYLDAEGFTTTFEFMADGKVKGIFDGEVGEGAYRISGNTVNVTIDEEQTSMTLNGNQLVWNYDNDAVMTFRRMD